MRVAMVNLTNGGLSGGYGKYLEHMVPLLDDDPRVRGLDVFVPPGAVDSLSFLEGRSVHSWPSNNAVGHRALRSAVAALRPDIVFVPTARWADFGPAPVTAMVRNMEPLVAPLDGNSVLEGAKNLLRREVARLTCLRANRIIAVSGFVREFLQARWAVSPDKIGLVYHGVEPPLLADQLARPRALAQFGDNEPFVFSAGSVRPARGLGDLIGAMKSLADMGRSIHAVVAGAPTSGTERYQRRLRDRIEAVGLQSTFTWTGALTRAEMAWCFQRCATFVMTTRAEACPNTALEAMSYGAVIVSADAQPLPEIFRDAAVYYRRGDCGALAQRIREALAMNEARRDALRVAARRRAADFDWRTTAKRTVDELVHCVENTASGSRA